MKRIANLIFPTLSLVSIFIALLAYWGKNDFVYRLTKIEEVVKIEKNLEILGEQTSVSADDLVREYKRDNESLRESTFKFSPDGKKAAYFQHKFTNSVEGIGDFDYTSLVIDKSGRIETLFQSDFRLSYFEWLNDEEIAVYRSCGTECMTAYVINLNTKLPQEFPLGVGYSWSPDKRYLLAYHYTSKYGISVTRKGDLYGRRIFELVRNQPPSGSRLTDKTKAIWSPDSSKLALIIKKDKEEKFELLVFNIRNDFNLLKQKDIEGSDFSNLEWKDTDVVQFEINGEVVEERSF